MSHQGYETYLSEVTKVAIIFKESVIHFRKKESKIINEKRRA
jgi:hypothetical protein